MSRAKRGNPDVQIARPPTGRLGLLALGALVATATGYGVSQIGSGTASTRTFVPDAVGVPAARAASIIRAAGLVPQQGSVITTTNCDYLGVVADQHTSGLAEGARGAEVAPGTTVVYRVGVAPGHCTS